MTSAAPDPTQLTCERCGATNPPHARFCHSCGARLDSDQAAQEERKLVSVLFVDLVGFTSSSDSADPEDVRDLLEEYHATAKECIEQFGGVVEKFIGDAVMAVFGVPVSHGDDAERAVRAGLRVLERVETLSLSARAAVNTGEAVVRLTDAAAGDPLALGDVVNTASRLQSHAPTGRLVVGAPTYRSTRQVIRYESTEAVAAKGKAEPVEAWLAVEPLPDTEGRVPASATFVGRRRELEVVRTVWEQAVTESRPHLLTLLGSPGVGKSRLCREVATLAERDGGRIVRGRCLPYEEKTGYQAFTQMVRQVAGIFDSDVADLARDKLGHTIERLFPPEEAPSHARDLGLLLGLGAEKRAIDKRVLFYSARRLVERLGEEQPTLVVVEDIHWAASSELDLFEYLTNVRETRVVFVALARPELLDVRPAWGGGSMAQTRIGLEPLAVQEATQLAGSLLPAGDDDVVQKLVEVAEGNPLFIEELVASARERSTADHLPVTVRAAIAARIDSLPPDARSILLSAAVIGRTFWQGALRAVSDIQGPEAVLDDLERRDLIRREPTSRLEGDVEFRFKHALIRDVAYGTLPRAVRRERHAAIARFVEKQTAGGDSFAWVLAHHWREAGDPARAVPYLMSAVSIAEQSWALHEVVELCSQALELTDDAAGRARIRLRRAHAFILAFDYPTALEDLEPALPDLNGQDLLDGLLLAAKSYVWTEQDTKALEMAERAVEFARQLDDEDGETAARAVVSEALAMRGEPGDIDRAIEVGDDVLRRWRRGVRSFERADHAHLHGDLKYWVGDYEESLKLGAIAKELGDDAHSIEAVLRGGGLGAVALSGLGRHEEALAAIDVTTQAEKKLGGDGAYLRNYTSMILRELNDLAGAREASELALERALMSSFGMPRRFAQSDLLFSALLEGDVGRAQVEWPSLWKDAQLAPAWTRWLIRGRLAAARAEIELRGESQESAAEWAQTAIAVAVSTRRRKYEAIARSTLGEALARLGRSDEALGELEAAVRIADGLVGQPARYNARAALTRAAYALGEDERATTANAEARALVDEFVATLAPERAELVRASPVVQELFATP